MEKDSVFFPCFLQCTAVEQEDNVLIEKFEVKGEELPDIAGNHFPQVFVNSPGFIEPGGGMEYTASVTLPGQCWHLRQHRLDNMFTFDGLVSAPAGDIRQELVLTNRADSDNNVVVIATGDACSRVRNLFVTVPAHETYRICLDPLWDYDDLHMISWLPFDAVLEIDTGLAHHDTVPIRVYEPGVQSAQKQTLAAYCQERSVYKRFSGSYLFGYFERPIFGEHAGDMVLHVFWPNHGELLHTTYLTGQMASSLTGSRISKQMMRDDVSTGKRKQGPYEEPEMKILLVSDMTAESFLPTADQPDVGAKALMPV
ncbi:MAG: hypothetical protein QNK37_34855 [Acidobacteriota bacterium]|nr:hypothetical protein [Acidobacteriota bacterium]